MTDLRKPTQAERVLAFIRANPGATALDIAHGCHPWVSNPRGRSGVMTGMVDRAFRNDQGRVIARLLVDGRIEIRCIRCGTWWRNQHPKCRSAIPA